MGSHSLLQQILQAQESNLGLPHDGQTLDQLNHQGSLTCLSMQETQGAQVWSLVWEDPLEKEMATHSNILAWKIWWTERTWRAIVHGIAKSHTWLSMHTHAHTHNFVSWEYYFCLKGQLHIFFGISSCMSGKCFWKSVTCLFSTLATKFHFPNTNHSFISKSYFRKKVIPNLMA